MGVLVAHHCHHFCSEEATLGQIPRSESFTEYRSQVSFVIIEAYIISHHYCPCFMIVDCCCLAFKIYFVSSKCVTKTCLESVHYIDNFSLLQLACTIKYLFSLFVWIFKELLEQTINIIGLSRCPFPCNFDLIKPYPGILCWLSDIFRELFFIISRSHLKRLLGIDNLLATLYTLILYSIAVFFVTYLASSTFGRLAIDISYLWPAK